VHLIHAIDGAFPSDMSLSNQAGLLEERRLFYVATTRARDDLSVYTPLRMPHHRRGRDDKHSYAVASRFLDEDAVSTMDIVEDRPAAPAPRSPVMPMTPRVSLPTLDELWT
jgi:DNA helicase II / ATP-dependent DNA helicase PcrA